jgi:uncharacterized UBP type Zn finger protein
MSEAKDLCDHFSTWKLVTSDKQICEKCVEFGDTWVHLRVCQTCGGVNCCDSSKNKHASKHYRETGHPMVISGERGERWAWCYEDEIYVEY